MRSPTGWPADALLFATCRLAISGLRYSNELGLKVPDELTIISFGQAEAFELYPCPVTYREPPMNDLGQRAVGLLIGQLNNPSEEPKQVLTEVKLTAQCSLNREFSSVKCLGSTDF